MGIIPETKRSTFKTYILPFSVTIQPQNQMIKPTSFLTQMPPYMSLVRRKHGLLHYKQSYQETDILVHNIRMTTKLHLVTSKQKAIPVQTGTGKSYSTPQQQTASGDQYLLICNSAQQTEQHNKVPANIHSQKPQNSYPKTNKHKLNHIQAVT